MFAALIMDIIEFVYLSLDFLDPQCQINISKRIPIDLCPLDCQSETKIRQIYTIYSNDTSDEIFRIAKSDS